MFRAYSATQQRLVQAALAIVEVSRAYTLGRRKTMGEDNKGSLGGVRVELEGPGRVAVRRETRESLAEVRVDDGARRDCTVATGLNFFDHMIETIAWNACLNVDVHF